MNTGKICKARISIYWIFMNEAEYIVKWGENWVKQPIIKIAILKKVLNSFH